jgi:Asp-tRNA(Asn)/Glu-tRNA(Gln) amidotransferase B subunit
MTLQEKLLNLIHNEVLADIETYLDELFELIASKKGDSEMAQEIEYMQEMKEEFETLVQELHNGEIDDEEAQEIINEIIDMKSQKQ